MNTSLERAAQQNPRRRLQFWCICLLFYFLMAMQVYAQLSVPEVFDRANPAFVTVLTPNALGSGFITSSDGTVVTNYHVIRGARKVTVRVLGTAGFHEYNVAGVTAYNDDLDYAVLRIFASGLPTVKIGNSDTLRIGDRVVALGNPKGLEHTVSDGVLSQSRKLEGHTMLQFTAPIDHGSSGGPLLNMRGEVVGITTEVFQGDFANFNFALPINSVKLSGLDHPMWTLDAVADSQQSKDRKDFQSKFSSYADPEGRFALSYPKGWRVERCSYVNPNPKLAWTLIKKTRIVAPGAELSRECNQELESTGISIEFAFRKPDSGFDIDEWVKELLDDWAKKPGFEVIEPPHALNFVGLGARAMSGKFSTIVRRDILAWHPPDFVFSTILANPVNRTEETKESFEVMLDTLRLLTPTGAH